MIPRPLETLNYLDGYLVLCGLRVNDAAVSAESRKPIFRNQAFGIKLKRLVDNYDSPELMSRF